MYYDHRTKMDNSTKEIIKLQTYIIEQLKLKHENEIALLKEEIEIKNEVISSLKEEIVIHQDYIDELEKLAVYFFLKFLY